MGFFPVTATYVTIYKSIRRKKIFTNEFEFDETVTTIMDETADYEDVHVLITDEEVFIRQWDDDREKYEIICMSPKMFYELQEAMKHPAGMFIVKFTEKI